MLLIAALLACGSKGSAPEDTADTGVAQDSGMTEETGTEDTDPGTGSIAGSVNAFDGVPPAGLEVQVCDQLCLPVYTDASGVFSAVSLRGGSYKVDALGEGVDGRGYGHSRVHVDLAAGETLTIPYALFVPRVEGPITVTSGTYTFGSLRWTVNAADLDAPFGFEEGVFSAGVVAAADIPPAWDTPAAPVAAVAFLPFGTEVSAPFTIALSGTWDSAAYDIYSVDAKGKLEGPVGTGAVADGELTASVLPSLLTWLLVVPR
jgi:hypothetical protein